MKSRSLVHTSFILLLVGSLALMAGCPIMMQPGSSAADSTGNITGKVLAHGETDNSGITVTAERTDGVRSVSVQKMLSGAPASRAIAAQATTDASGRYTLSGLPPGIYTLGASSRDALERSVTTFVTVSGGSTVEALLMRLTRTGEIAGTARLSDVQDSQGHLGIVVFIAGTSYSAMTAGDGSYTISYVPAGTGYTLVASKTGYDSVITNADVSVGQTTRVETLTLLPTRVPPTVGSVSGAVDLNHGMTDAGAFVYLPGTSHVSVTDDAGAFRLTGVTPGSCTLVASKEGFSPASVPVSVEAGIDSKTGVLPLYYLGPFFVTYDGNGATGSVPIDSTGYAEGAAVVVLASGTLVKTGYSFAGWNTQADGSGTPYAPGQTFPMGRSDVTLYASWTFVPTPINVGGYWNLTIKVGDQQYPPMELYVRQTGTSLSAAMSGGFYLAGEVEGLEFDLSGNIQGADVTFSGKVSGSEVGGTASSGGIIVGSFTMVPLALHFGHLDVGGSLDGAPIIVNTEYATATKQTTVTDIVTFGLYLNGSFASFRFASSELSPKTFTVVTNEPSNQPGVMAVTIWQDNFEHKASGGSVDITSASDAGIDGTFTLTSFSDGSGNLTGSFHLVFGSGEGTVSSVVGLWMGSHVEATAAVPTFSQLNINTFTFLNIIFMDDTQSIWLGFPVEGDLAIPGYTMPDQAHLDVMWSPRGGLPVTIEGGQSPGRLDITSVSPTGIGGSFNASFSADSAISGSFNVVY